MVVNAIHGRLVVEGAHHHAKVDAQLLCFLGQGDGLLGGGAAGASDNRLAAGSSLYSNFHQLDTLVEGEQRSFAGGAGDNQGITQVILDQVVDQVRVHIVADLLVLIVGGNEGQQDLAILCGKLFPCHAEFSFLYQISFLECIRHLSDV